ncbi:MAG: hypothetical protein ABI605_14350 [Rhizobacter sp.]
MRGALVANALTESISDAVQQGRDGRIQALINRAVQDECLVAIGLCADDGRLLQHTVGYPPTLDCKAARQIAVAPASACQAALRPPYSRAATTAPRR